MSRLGYVARRNAMTWLAIKVYQQESTTASEQDTYAHDSIERLAHEQCYKREQSFIKFVTDCRIHYTAHMGNRKIMELVHMHNDSFPVDDTIDKWQDEFMNYPMPQLREV